MKCFSIFIKNKSKNKKRESRTAPESRNQAKSDNSEPSSLPTPRSIPELYKEKEHNLRVFFLQELRDATHGFNKILKIGQGGFGGVYKGTISPLNGPGEPIVVAIKRLNTQGLQGHKEWLTEVQFLGVVNHPNLDIVPMTVKEGLEVKSSNVLLDESFKPKLSDFGFAREGPSGDLTHVSTAVVGTYGYADQEYVKTGHLTIQSDVWTFGVVLYEILTGRQVVERNRPTSEQKLLDWVKQFPPESKKFSMIMDPRLRNSYSLRAAQKVGKLADSCPNKNAKERPTMNQVVESLKQAIQESEEGTSSVNKAPITFSSRNGGRRLK
ncbi:putative plant SNARE 11-like isoform X1 [Hibiscus syriacus]|uniref:Plant SNARE 11-like isoform X1 n=1 Tax=Hibiscus syriacus TaxID=106335 RepID=A0A6A3BBF1_HIBSY|nr:putative plant SNARE 11-like isoform X1 [Hibiscus syriacus]